MNLKSRNLLIIVTGGSRCVKTLKGEHRKEEKKLYLDTHNLP